MGSGKKKAHESFPIAPAPEMDEIHALTESADSGDVVVDGLGVSSGAGGAAGGGGTEAMLDAAAAPPNATTCSLCGKAYAPTGAKGAMCPDCAAVISAANEETTTGDQPPATTAAAEIAELEEMLAQPSAEEPVPAAHLADTPATTAAGDQWSGDDLLTPIPEELAVGDGIGTAVAVGGADLCDGAAILTSYQDSKGGPSHEVLRATLTAEAEEKLLDALSPPDAPKVPIQVAEQVSGPLPVDKEQLLHHDLARAAKSINHHIKTGTPVPQHTLDRIDTVDAKLQALEASVVLGSAEHQMVKQYQAGVAQCKQRIAADFATPYDAGGKIPHIDQFEHTGEVLVTKMVPDPTFQGAGFAVDKRKMSRIEANLVDGVSKWDGVTRAQNSSGVELAVDLGDGFQAVVRPTSMNPPGQCAASLRGTVEIVAPPGAGHQKQLLNKLGELNIVNRPMNAAEAEWTYLQRNIVAHNLGSHSHIVEALKSSTDIEEAHAHRLLVARAPQAIGLDDAGLSKFARKLQLDAEADALPDKVRLLKDGMAKALGHADGAAMVNNLSYEPTPHRARGWLTWGRIGQSQADLKPLFANKVMTHHISGGQHDLVPILTSGVLACTERRRMMGVKAGSGMSESSDMNSGGANSVFLRMAAKKGSFSGPRLIWNNPEKLLSRTDWYAYNGDHFGAAIAGTGHSTSGQTRDPKVVAKHNNSGNEVMISHGLDLLGADAPDKVLCPASYRATLLAELKAAGITTIGGKPIEKVVVSK